MADCRKIPRFRDHNYVKNLVSKAEIKLLRFFRSKDNGQRDPVVRVLLSNTSKPGDWKVEGIFDTGFLKADHPVLALSAFRDYQLLGGGQSEIKSLPDKLRRTGLRIDAWTGPSPMSLKVIGYAVMTLRFEKIPNKTSNSFTPPGRTYDVETLIFDDSHGKGQLEYKMFFPNNFIHEWKVLRGAFNLRNLVDFRLADLGDIKRPDVNNIKTDHYNIYSGSQNRIRPPFKPAEGSGAEEKWNQCCKRAMQEAAIRDNEHKPNSSSSPNVEGSACGTLATTPAADGKPDGNEPSPNADQQAIQSENNQSKPDNTVDTGEDSKTEKRPKSIRQHLSLRGILNRGRKKDSPDSV